MILKIILYLLVSIYAQTADYPLSRAGSNPKYNPEYKQNY